MTPEQSKQLKKGDEIFIRARYIEITGDGDVLFSHSARNVCDDVVKTYDYTHPENVIWPPTPPKYDPARKLKKGDKVKPRSWRNRRPTARLGATRIIPDTRVLEVASDELHEHVTLIYGDEVINMHICFLELVTPVEELEPYFVKETASVYEVFNRNENNSSVAIFFKSQYSIEKAKERAEAERDRLNAEYRKEKNNV